MTAQMNAAIRVVCAVLVGLLGGCARFEPRAGFADVEKELASRLPQRVVWSTGGECDARVEQDVRAMLASELSVDQAVQIALLNNRNLQATYESLGIAQADLVAAGLLKNPVFNADLRFSTRGGGTGVDLSLVGDFLDVLFIPMRRSVAEHELAAAQWAVSAAVVDLAGDVRQRVYELQAAQQAVEIRKTVNDAAAASYEFAKRLQAAGNITDLDLANEQALAGQAKLDLAAAQVEVTQLRERLNALMGLWGEDTRWTVAGRLPDLPPEDVGDGGLEAKALERSLELAQSRSRMETAAVRAGMMRPLGWLSELEVGAAAEREVEGGWSVGPAFALPIPIFSQGQPAVAAAEARVRAEAQRHHALAVEVRAAARAAQQALAAARQRVIYYQDEMLPLRRQITQETQKQHNAMLIGAFQLLRAKQEEVEAGRAYVAALREYWLARARLETILAGRLPREASQRQTHTDEGRTHE
jgi:cobalt-zinc-cadmium efflux system outer membrane protein